jgi:4-amino-4-deoxy-L-arabinose transferase-like glycosyltransferase
MSTHFNGYGIFTILLTTISCCFAFRCYNKGKESFTLFFLLISGLCLRIYTASDQFIHLWDERYHALVAKHLINNPLTPTLYKNPILPYDSHNWTCNKIWLHKQPLPLWVIAGSLKIFGINEFALRIPSVLLSSAGILLTYSICKYVFNNNRTAFIAAFFYTINGLIIELSGGRDATDHPDVFFMFFIQLAIYLTIVFIQTKNTAYNILAGISLAAALLCKWLPALIVLPIWLLFVLDSKQFSKKQILFRFTEICIVVMLFFLPWQFYIHQHFPLEASWENNFNIKHFFEVLDGQGGAWYYFLNRIRMDYGELVYLPICWVMYSYLRQKNNLRLLGVIIWFVVPIAFFSFAATKMQGYILFTAPALFIITAAFYTQIYQYDAPQKLRWTKQLMLLLLLALPIRYCIERVKPFEAQDTSHQWVKDLKNWHEKNDSNAILLGYKAPIEAMFYTEATVYEQIPEPNIIDSLLRRHYAVFVNDSKELSAAIRNVKGVQIVHLTQPN